VTYIIILHDKVQNLQGRNSVMSSTERRRAKRAATAIIPVAALLATALGAAVPAQAAASASTISIGRPAWATASADRGAVATTSTVTARVYLASQNPAGLAALAKAVSEPGSSSYGKFLTAAQATARYGPSAAHTATLESYLTGHGIKVTSATAHYLEISGSAAHVEAAFGTGLDNYSTRTGTYRAPTGNLRLPTAAATAITTVTGLDSLVDTSARPDSVSVAKAIGVPSKSPGTGPIPEPCSTSWGQVTVTGLPVGYTKNTPSAECSYYPSQLREAYGVTASGLTGKGATVAIVDAYASSTMLADANEYATDHGDSAFAPGQYTEDVTPANWELQDECGGPEGWAPEEALDVEMVHGLAPDADVVYVGANSCSDDDFLAAEQTVVDNHLADVVSNSWGEIMHGPDGYFDTSIIPAYEQTFEQGAIEGIGFNFSSGDCGDQSPASAGAGANCDPNTTEAQTTWPNSDPWVTSVGGTVLATSTASGKYDFEAPMGDVRSVLSADGTAWDPFPGYFYFGGGGGTTQDFAQPWYQAGVVPSKLAHTLLTGATSATAQRVVPDVAMNADLVNSTLVGISDGSPYSEAGYGGTSVASPSFAGILADAIQAQGGTPLGLANPALYERSSLFTDVVAYPEASGIGHKTLSAVLDLGLNADGTRRVRDYALGEDSSLTATTGFDDATGLGSPNAALLESFLTGE
jgi:subtilase family serine protease